MKWTIARMVLILIVSFVGSGCTKTVMVPVSSCPVPPVITMPDLEVSRLPKKPTTPDALKAMMMDHITLKSTLEQCIISLDGYRTP